MDKITDNSSFHSSTAVKLKAGLYISYYLCCYCYYNNTWCTPHSHDNTSQTISSMLYDIADHTIAHFPPTSGVFSFSLSPSLYCSRKSKLLCNHASSSPNEIPLSLSINPTHPLQSCIVSHPPCFDPLFRVASARYKLGYSLASRVLVVWANISIATVFIYV